MTAWALEMAINTRLGWLELEDAANGYELHKDSIAGAQTTWRKQEVDSPWVEGSFTTRAVRGNVPEAVHVWVSGETHYELDERLSAFTDALGQLQYAMRVRTGDLLETWTCFPGDFSIETQQEYRFATIALVRATVPRLPTTVKVQVP
jgi:hypothetical protein